jgi:Uma2 family endonuclease
LKDKGAEPSDCFYVQNVALIIGKDDLNLQHDPPPDIVIESALTSSSLDRFAIYAGLGVLENRALTFRSFHKTAVPKRSVKTKRCN